MRMILMTGQCDSVRKDVFLGKGWRRQKPNRNFMRMVLISGQCDSVSKDVISKKRKVWMNAKQILCVWY